MSVLDESMKGGHVMFYTGVWQIAQGSYQADWGEGKLGGLQGASPLQEGRVEETLA